MHQLDAIAAYQIPVQRIDYPVDGPAGSVEDHCDLLARNGAMRRQENAKKIPSNAPLCLISAYNHLPKLAAKISLNTVRLCALQGRQSLLALTSNVRTDKADEQGLAVSHLADASSKTREVGVGSVCCQKFLNVVHGQRRQREPGRVMKWMLCGHHIKRLWPLPGCYDYLCGRMDFHRKQIGDLDRFGRLLVYAIYH